MLKVGLGVERPKEMPLEVLLSHVFREVLSLLGRRIHNQIGTLTERKVDKLRYAWS